MKTTTLAEVPLFASLPSFEVERLTLSLQRRELSRGDILLREGERGEHFYLIVRGELEVIKAMDSPDEQLVGINGAGDFIGEMSLLNPDGLRNATARARCATSVLEMRRADLDALLLRYPQMAYDLARVLSQRLQHTAGIMITQLHKKNDLLTTANHQLTAAVEQLRDAQAQLIEQEKLRHELQVAHNIQQSILPATLPCLGGFDFGACMEPAEAIGGDFYDFIEIDNDTIGIAIGDVSGKGVPAALFMALTCSLLRAEAARTITPVETLCNINRQLHKMSNGRTFVTVTYGVLHRSSGKFVYARAGHEPILSVDKDGTASRIEPQIGQPLGLLIDPELTEDVIILEPGSTLLLYTDGATEAIDENLQFFGLERLLEALGSQHKVNARETCLHLFKTLDGYRGNMHQADDITLVALHVQ